ncbi:MAG: hypothetical protein ACTSRW_09075 [Candidatus Helarchaeota archaeon]
MHSDLSSLFKLYLDEKNKLFQFKSYLGFTIPDLFGMAAAQMICRTSPVLFIDSLKADEILRSVRIFQNGYEFSLLIILISNIFNENIERQHVKRLKRIFRAINIPFFSIRKMKNIPFMKDVNELGMRLQTPTIIHLNNSIWREFIEY